MVRSPYYWLTRVFRPVQGWFPWVWWVGIGYTAVATPMGLLDLTSIGPPFLWMSAIGVLWILHQLLKLQVVLAATQGAAGDCRDGSLELLVVSGVTPGAICEGLRRAVWHQHAAFTWSLAILQGWFFLFTFWRLWPLGSKDIAPGLAFFGVMLSPIVFLWTDHRALTAMGLREALRTADPQKAFRSAWLRVMWPGWVLTGTLILLAMSNREPAIWNLVVWLLVGLGWPARVTRRADVDLEYGFMAYAAGLPFDSAEWSLRDDFRRAADA